MMANGPWPKVLRLSEVTAEAYQELQQRYATLLTDYIALGELHVQQMRRYHDLLERQLVKETLVP